MLEVPHDSGDAFLQNTFNQELARVIEDLTLAMEAKNKEVKLMATRLEYIRNTLESSGSSADFAALIAKLKNSFSVHIYPK